jgi:hypothetical protein
VAPAEDAGGIRHREAPDGITGLARVRTIVPFPTLDGGLEDLGIDAERPAGERDEIGILARFD